jgi:type II secretory pathway pseudopilin PulG
MVIHFSSGSKAGVRSAFTMIELIFAIVLIAVVMLTIPTMIQVNNKALEGNAAQEAIFLVSAVLSETTTLVWDGNSDDVNGTNVILSKILDTNNTGNAAYKRPDLNTSIRNGGLDQDLHRRFFDAEIHPAQTTKIIVSQPLTNSAAAIGGYKNQYTIVATREYASDTPHAGTSADPFEFTVPNLAVGAASSPTNVKMTQVEINATIDGNNLTISRLRAYTCNIGETDYAKRRF